jgi:hypothetical protein
MNLLVSKKQRHSSNLGCGDRLDTGFFEYIHAQLTIAWRVVCHILFGIMCLFLVGLKLLDQLAQMRCSESDDLNIQMDLFDEIRQQDEDEMLVPGGLNLNSHLDMCNAVLCKVSDTPRATNFLNILQHLYLIDNDGQVGDRIWEASEKLIQRATLAASEQIIEQIVNDQLSRMEDVTQSDQVEIKTVSVQDNGTAAALALTEDSQIVQKVDTNTPNMLPVPEELDITSPPPPLPGQLAPFPDQTGIPPLQSVSGELDVPPPSLPGQPGIPALPPIPGQTGVPLPPPGPPSVPGVPAPPSPPGAVITGAVDVLPIAVTALAASQTPMPAKKMKKFNWSKLAHNRVQSASGQTVWDRVLQVQALKHQGTQVDFEEIENLFSQPQTAKKEKKKEEKKKGNVVVFVQLFDLTDTQMDRQTDNHIESKIN